MHQSVDLGVNYDDVKDMPVKPVSGEIAKEYTSNDSQNQGQATVLDKEIDAIPEISQEYEPLKRSTRERKTAISDDYEVYLLEHEFDIGMMEEDPENLHQALKSSNSDK